MPEATPKGADLRTVFVALGSILLLLLVYVLRGVLVPLFVAFLLAYALDPVVDKLERWRLPRPFGAALVMLSLIAVIVVFCIFAVPVLLEELRLAGEDLPAQLSSVLAKTDVWLAQTFRIHIPHTVSDLTKTLSNAQLSTAAQAGAAAVFGTLSYVGVLLSLLIIPVFTFYLLIDFDRIVRKVGEMIPRRHVRSVGSVALQVHETLGGWVRGQLTANLVLAALYALGLRFVDVRLAVPLGILTGMLAFVPYIGFSVGFVLALAMAILEWTGVGTIAAVCVVMFSVQLLDAFVVTPRIVGRSVGLGPLEVLVTMMGAGALFGFLGVFLAVPLGAVVKILIRRGMRSYLGSRYYLAQEPTFKR
jgi:predicted PurR-regulated permease PerM